MYLKAEESAKTVTLDLDVRIQRPYLPNSVSVAVRDYEDRERRIEKDIQGDFLSVDIEIPQPRSFSPLVEVEWRFKRSSCQTPYSCDSAVLLRMYSH